MRHIYVREKHTPHPRVAVAKNVIGTLDRHLTHQRHCEGCLDLLGKVLAATLPERGYTVYIAINATAFSRQAKHDHALLGEDVQMLPLHRFDTVAEGH
jgi:hypothetical protein